MTEQNYVSFVSDENKFYDSSTSSSLCATLVENLQTQRGLVPIQTTTALDRR